MVISAAVLLGFLFSSEGLQSLNQISGNIRFLWLLGAFLAAVFAWVLEGLVLHLFCKKAYPEWKFHYSFCMGMVGVLYSALTPFSTGGQPMQIYSMRRLGMDTGAAGSIIAMKTLVYQIVLVFYSLAMVVWKLPFFQNHISNFSFVTIIGLLCNSAFIILVLLFASASGLRISCSAKGYGFFISCIYASIRRSGMRKLAESFKYFMAAPACWENRSSCIWGLAFLQSFRSRAPA